MLDGPGVTEISVLDQDGLRYEPGVEPTLLPRGGRHLHLQPEDVRARLLRSRVLHAERLPVGHRQPARPLGHRRGVARHPAREEGSEGAFGQRTADHPPQDQQPGEEKDARPQRGHGRTPGSNALRARTVGAQTLQNRDAAAGEKLHPDAEQLAGGDEAAGERDLRQRRTPRGLPPDGLRDHNARGARAGTPKHVPQRAPGGAPPAAPPGGGVHRLPVGARHRRRHVCQTPSWTPQSPGYRRGAPGQQFPALGRGHRDALSVQHVPGAPSPRARHQLGRHVEAVQRLQVTPESPDQNFCGATDCIHAFSRTVFYLIGSEALLPSAREDPSSPRGGLPLT